MDQQRESGVFYRSFYEAGKSLTEEQRGKYYTLIFDLMFEFQKRKSDDPIVNAMFLLIAPQIEANIRKYFNGKEPKIKQDESKDEAKDKQEGSETEGNVYVDVYVDENDDANDDANDDVSKVRDRKRFTVPTLEHVQEYCSERSNGIDAEAFINHYESKGWMIGKNKMKDWKACVRTREQKRKEELKAKEPQTMEQWRDLRDKMGIKEFTIKYGNEQAKKIMLYFL